jgi:hypothetical protein
MEQAAKTEKIDWMKLENDEQIANALTEFLRGLSINREDNKAKTHDEIQAMVKDALVAVGFPSTVVAISVSNPDDQGERIVTGVTDSPLTKNPIKFTSSHSF